MRGRLIGAALAAVVSCGGAGAQTPCDQFSWSVRREVEWLTSTNLPAVTNGATLAGDGSFVMVLQSTSSVQYALPPERAPKTANTFGGIVTISAPSRPGTYHNQITLAEEAWIDVVQNGHRVGSSAFTGRAGCDGVRESVRFEIASGPLVIQISGASSERIAIAAAPAS